MLREQEKREGEARAEATEREEERERRIMEAVDRRVEEELERRRDEIEEEVGSAANFATLAFAVKLIFQTDQFGFEIRPQSAGNGTQSNFVFMG